MSDRVGNPRELFARPNMHRLRENLQNGIRPKVIIDEVSLAEVNTTDKVDLHSIALFWQEE